MQGSVEPLFARVLQLPLGQGHGKPTLELVRQLWVSVVLNPELQTVGESRFPSSILSGTRPTSVAVRLFQAPPEVVERLCQLTVDPTLPPRLCCPCSMILQRCGREILAPLLGALQLVCAMLAAISNRARCMLAGRCDACSPPYCPTTSQWGR